MDHLHTFGPPHLAGPLVTSQPSLFVSSPSPVNSSAPLGNGSLIKDRCRPLEHRILSGTGRIFPDRRRHNKMKREQKKKAKDASRSSGC